MTKREEEIVYIEIPILSGETLRCDYCDEHIKGEIAYLYAPDGRKVENVSCRKCKRER